MSSGGKKHAAEGVVQYFLERYHEYCKAYRKHSGQIPQAKWLESIQ